jgi:hypothetical protein
MKYKIQNLSALFISTVVLTATHLRAQNLLTNGDFSSGSQGFFSAYSFVASGTSQSPNTFGIRSSSVDYNPAFTAFSDHTTGTGNMMLVDGSLGAGTTVWSETIPVTTNSPYIFSGWVTAADSSNVPTLRFFINGTPVGSDLTLSSAAGQWQQFLIVWNSGANTSAALSIEDENTVSLGNDFAMDDLSFAPTTAPATTPTLNLASTGNQTVLFWPTSATNYVLQSTTNLASPNWTAATDAVPVKAYTVTNSTPARFFRLQLQP